MRSPGQPGPVAILYAHDSLAGNVAPDSQPMLYPTRHYLPPLPPPAEQQQVEARPQPHCWPRKSRC